jgi:hypothetical protein
MGLDTYAAKALGKELTRRDRWAFRKAKVALTSGMFSLDVGGFRGKMYDDLIRCITGVSLYDAWIPPDTVREMSEALDRCDPELVTEECQESSVYDHTPHEVLQLRAFFRVCAKRKLGLVGWW